MDTTQSRGSLVPAAAWVAAIIVAAVFAAGDRSHDKRAKTDQISKQENLAAPWR